MLNAGQVNTFCKKLGLTDPRKINGEWFAVDDPEDELYHISEDNYWAAWYEGDLA